VSLFVWLTLLGTAIAFREGSHLAFGFLEPDEKGRREGDVVYLLHFLQTEAMKKWMSKTS